MKLAFLLPSLLLAFAHAPAGGAPFDPSALAALQPPAEHGAFHSGWISLGLEAADLKEKQVSPGHITDVGEGKYSFISPPDGGRRIDAPPCASFRTAATPSRPLKRKASALPAGRRSTAWWALS